MGDAPPSLRIDKWLWYARFFKTRALAGQIASKGKVRLNGQHVRKASHPVREGDTLTFPQANRIRVIRVLALGQRRGPASEAAQLYQDLDIPVTKPADSSAAAP
ncbi:MAG: RNA-binding S4 domain-containing protein [Pseudomonadota bacterium]